MRRGFGAVGTVALVLGTAGYAIQTAAAGSTPGGLGAQRWIVYSGALGMVQSLDPGLAEAAFDNPGTYVQNPNEPPTSQVPAGWSSVAEQKYTSETAFAGDAGSGAISPTAIPAALYDTEDWSATPTAEQDDPCSFIRQFGSVAHQHALTSIMAPAQDLVNADGGQQGGEGKLWEGYLRMNYAGCAAQGNDWLTIQSQTDQNTEADFDEFVTQAALQARAANPGVVLTDGFSTNPASTTSPTPAQMYQDQLDTNGGVSGSWLNIPGTGARPDLAVQYLELVSGALPLYLHAGYGLDTDFPTAGTASTFSLGTVGASLTWTDTADSLPAGTVIPAGTYTFEPWTDGTGGTAGLGIEVGYCQAAGCSDPTPIISSSAWTATVSAGTAGVTNSYTTTSPTTLPPGGPYQMYTRLVVTSPGAFNLDVDSSTAETNLAIPRPSTIPTPAAQSPMLFLGAGQSADPAAPTGSAASSMSLTTAGAGSTWTSARTYPAGTVVPAGRYDFQAWTDGAAGASAQLGLEFGYCAAGNCAATRHPILAASNGWTPTVSSDSAGQYDPAGLSARTKSSATTLPSGGPYQLYFTVTVRQPGNFDLLFGSASAATNLATPFLQPTNPAPPGTTPPSTPSTSSSGTTSATPTPSPTPTPTVTATSTSSATTTSTPSASGTTPACHVDYTTSSQWPGGFTASVTVNNTGPTTINGWTVTWTFPGDQQVTSVWNATIAQSGANVTATAVDYNATISPGANQSFGFQGTWTNNDSPPTDFTVNGAACT